MQARSAVKPADASGGPDRRAPAGARPRSAAQPSPLGFVSRIPTPPGARRLLHNSGGAARPAPKLPPLVARCGSLEPTTEAGTDMKPEVLAGWDAAALQPGAACAEAATPAPPTSWEAVTPALSALGGEAAGTQGPVLERSSAQARLCCWPWRLATSYHLPCTHGWWQQHAGTGQPWTKAGTDLRCWGTLISESKMVPC